MPIPFVLLGVQAWHTSGVCQNSPSLASYHRRFARRASAQNILLGIEGSLRIPDPRSLLPLHAALCADCRHGCPSGEFQYVAALTEYNAFAIFTMALYKKVQGVSISYNTSNTSPISATIKHPSSCQFCDTSSSRAMFTNSYCKTISARKRL